MRRRREAILHIGHKKTGTSFIQRQFHRHRDALREHGLLYPLPEPNHSYALSGLFRQRAVAQAPTPIDDYLSGERSLEDLDAELNASPWTRLLLSAEVLSGFSRRDLARLRNWLRGHVVSIRIVFVVRDPVDWAVSVAQQYLKTRGDVAAILSDPDRVDWSTIIGRMRAMFGEDAITVLEYEALAQQRDLFAARFARAIGLPASIAVPLRSVAPSANESLSMEAALLLGRLNGRIPQRIDGARNPARSGLEPRVFTGLPGSRFDLPDAARRLAYERSREEVAFLRDAFGITRYDYPSSALPPSRYTEAVSPAFLDALAERTVAMNAAATSRRLLLDAHRRRAEGDTTGADALLREAARRFPHDRHVIRAVGSGD